MDPSPALEARIREHAKKLEQFYDRIISCDVAVDGVILPDPATAAEKVATDTHELHEELSRARAKVPDADSVIIEGDPFPAIEQAARETGADLIVIGTHGRRGVRHAILGSVAEKLVQRGPCPVLTVRAK